MALAQVNQAVAMLGKADQLSNLANDGPGISNKIEDLYKSVAHIKYGRKDPASRAVTVGSQFALGTLAINAAQFLGAPLALINEDWHDSWIAFNKQSWGLLITTMTNWWSPTLVRVSGGKSVRGQLQKAADGSLYCDFSERMVLIANHQIYTDWLYLWYIGYANGMHGRIHVVLKESLKKIPVVGWGMTLSKFIFLKRDWEKDKAGLAKHLQSLNRPEDPMWLMFFPEGTNLAQSTREKSQKWAEKNGLKDFQHVLLPRSTGLHFCLLKLRETVDYVYDCTVAYEGVKRGEYAQDIYTIESSFLGGRPPKSVNMYWRRFKISTIPLDDINAFDIWLRARWAEKDVLMETYMRTGRFPADDGIDQTPEGETRRGAGFIETQVKPYKWYEILQVFAPIATFVIVLLYFYNITLPLGVFDTIQDWAGYGEDEIKQKLRVGQAPKLGKPKAITSQTVAKTLKPPSIQSDQSSVVSASVKSQRIAKSPLKQPTSQPKTLSAPQTVVNKAPTPNKGVSGSIPSNAPAKVAPATTSAPKIPPNAKPTSATDSILTPALESKPLQINPPTASPSRKPLPKPKPKSVPKPLKKTVYPPTPSASSTKAPTKKEAPISVATNSKASSLSAPTSKVPAKKSPPAVISKSTPKAQPLKKPAALPKTRPRLASTQATTEDWSDTTAVESPWADRPSGKRAIKAQATRKDRIKMEKKQQRLHLEKTGA